MGQIVNFFKMLIDLLVGAVQFVVKLLKDLVYVVQLLGQAVANLPQYLGFLPSMAVSVLVTVFAIVVIYKVLGREG